MSNEKSCFDFECFSTQIDGVVEQIVTNPASITLEEMMNLFMDTGAVIGHMKATLTLARYSKAKEITEIETKIGEFQAIYDILLPTILAMGHIVTDEILKDIMAAFGKDMKKRENTN